MLGQRLHPNAGAQTNQPYVRCPAPIKTTGRAGGRAGRAVSAAQADARAAGAAGGGASTAAWRLGRRRVQQRSWGARGRAGGAGRGHTSPSAAARAAAGSGGCCSWYAVKGRTHCGCFAGAMPPIARREQLPGSTPNTAFRPAPPPPCRHSSHSCGRRSGHGRPSVRRCCRMWKRSGPACRRACLRRSCRPAARRCGLCCVRCAVLAGAVIGRPVMG